MKALVILNDSGYGSERSYNALRLASALAKREEVELRTFLMREHLKATVHQQVDVRVLELADEETGSKIELEGNRLPITHSEDVISELAG